MLSFLGDWIISTTRSHKYRKWAPILRIFLGINKEGFPQFWKVSMQQYSFSYSFPHAPLSFSLLPSFLLCYVCHFYYFLKYTCMKMDQFWCKNLWVCIGLPNDRYNQDTKVHCPQNSFVLPLWSQHSLQTQPWIPADLHS